VGIVRFLVVLNRSALKQAEGRRSAIGEEEKSGRGEGVCSTFSPKSDNIIVNLAM